MIIEPFRGIKIIMMEGGRVPGEEVGRWDYI